MKIATILTNRQTIYVKYEDLTNLQMIERKIKISPLQMIKHNLKKQGFECVENHLPIKEKQYHLFT
jgi:hypothetical protein